MSAWDAALADLLARYRSELASTHRADVQVSYDPVAKRISFTIPYEVPMSVSEAEREAFLRQVREEIANHLGDIPNKEQAIDKVMASLCVDERRPGPVEIRDLALQMAKLEKGRRR